MFEMIYNYNGIIYKYNGMNYKYKRKDFGKFSFFITGNRTQETEPKIASRDIYICLQAQWQLIQAPGSQWNSFCYSKELYLSLEYSESIMQSKCLFLFSLVCQYNKDIQFSWRICIFQIVKRQFQILFQHEQFYTIDLT